LLYHSWEILSLFGYWSLTQPKKKVKKNLSDNSYTMNSDNTIVEALTETPDEHGLKY